MNPCGAIVIGGGPGGSAAALLLARAGWSIALLERKAFPRRKVCGEYLSATNWPLLEHLGVRAAFNERAGPPVTRVGLFAGSTIVEAPLPRAGNEFGRALSREHLDTLLLDEARRAGAVVHQPANATAIRCIDDRYHVEVDGDEFQAPIVIAAHGSWGKVPTLEVAAPIPGSDADLFGFKAHFSNSDLPAGLMPLLAFPGGYGGMVHCDGGRVSLSCCIRRDWLARVQGRHGGDAGKAVFAHIDASCRGVRQALRGAQREGAWLGVGPIRPGIRVRPEGGLFRVGNAAGEAHPVIAEGISMALQSAWLLARRLQRWKRGEPLQRVGAAYAQEWRRCFAPRLRASAVIAHWAMRRAAVTGVMPVLRAFPRLLTFGARMSGKANSVVP